MRSMILVSTVLACLLVATPAAAKPHDDGHTPPGQAKKEERIDHPDDAPGNSGWAQWCKVHWHDHDYANHGQCVADHAGRRAANRDDDDEDHHGRGAHALGHDESDGQYGALAITDIDVHGDGSFIVRGVGAGDRVIVEVGGPAELVAGVGQAEPDAAGAWEVRGVWACQDSGSSHDARVRASDTDEGTSTTATFPCSAED